MRTAAALAPGIAVLFSISTLTSAPPPARASSAIPRTGSPRARWPRRRPRPTRCRSPVVGDDAQQPQPEPVVDRLEPHRRLWGRCGRRGARDGHRGRHGGQRLRQVGDGGSRQQRDDDLCSHVGGGGEGGPKSQPGHPAGLCRRHRQRHRTAPALRGADRQLGHRAVLPRQGVRLRLHAHLTKLPRRAVGRRTCAAPRPPNPSTSPGGLPARFTTVLPKKTKTTVFGTASEDPVLGDWDGNGHAKHQ